ncbi:MAG: zinc ribbon domain-containing protein [Polyangiaceae bacterium]
MGKRGRPAGTGKTPSLLSGLLRCGACGGSMTVVGRKWKAGVAYTRFGCTAHYSRGNSICQNGLSVSERKAQNAIVGALKQALDEPRALARFEAAFRERASELDGEQQASTPDLDREARDAEKRIANLTESLARVGWSEALSVKLAEEERRLDTLKAKRYASTRRELSPATPDSATIRRFVQNLFALLDADVARGREALARHIRPIVMTPEADGPRRHYRATGAFNLSSCLRAASGDQRSGKSSCAGRI